MEVWSCFFGNSRRAFFKLVGSIMNNMEKINTRKGKMLMLWYLFVDVMITFIFYLNVTYLLIIPLVFIIFTLSWKGSWSQRTLSWKLETSSWITNHDPLSRTLETFISVFTSLDISFQKAKRRLIIFYLWMIWNCIVEVRKDWTH